MKKNILKQTASQTVGPFFAYCLTSGQYGYNFTSVSSPRMRKKGMKGIPISISGRVFDGENIPLNDAVLEIIQADPTGHYATKTNYGVFGFGRSGTGVNPDCKYAFETFKPGSTIKTEAPHLNVTVFARGIQNHLFTRIYFPEDKNLFHTDQLLKQVDTSFHERLIAEPTEQGHYVFNIFLQGKKQSIFLDI